MYKLTKPLLIIPLYLSTLSSFGQDKVIVDSLKIVLENVYKSDQEPRMVADSLEKKYSFTSPLVREHGVSISKQDSINKNIVSSILDRYGWLSARETSENANEALFLVVQHADLSTQLKYLPLLKEAVQKGKAKSANYALLIDRTNMKQGKFQVYGSQISGDANGNFYIYPIIDEPNVNIRRMSMGLTSLEEYAARFHINYVLPKRDFLKGKIIIMGQLYGEKGGLDSAAIYWGNNKFLTRTDNTGGFKMVIDKIFFHWALIFRKEGYVSSSYVLDESEKDVLEMHIRLTKR